MKSLNETFVPKTIMRKTELNNTNTLLQKNKFDKTHGNIYVELDPPQIKFNAYQINKVNTATLKIINKAPIVQRFHILPPTQPYFSIKVNKKGPVPSGMYQTVQVSFKASQYKYLYDVIKINSQTQNFVVPLYAYPSIPNLNTIFPKAIDFGSVELSQTESNIYPIINPTPLEYSFQFLYQKQCNQIMINPLKGVIPGNGTVNIQIAFIPTRKMTYHAEVVFRIQQFDFEPIQIKIIGTGKDKQLTKTFKRLKSSKLAPLAKQQDKPKDKLNQTQTFLNTKNLKDKPSAIIKRMTGRQSYPKLSTTTINRKQQATSLQPQKEINVKNLEQRGFLSRFNKVQEMDKQKDIKFSQYLGDKAMTSQQVQFQKQIQDQANNLRLSLMKMKCETRFNPQKTQEPEVQYSKVIAKSSTWDDNRNDELYQRKTILSKFVKAASHIIEQRRMFKRLQKINQFLSGCKSKEQVAKKVQQDYQKSLDSQSGFAFKKQIDLDFTRFSLAPRYLPLQVKQTSDQSANKRFVAQGKPQFDDLSQLKANQPYQIQRLAYKQAILPPDFVNLSKIIPPIRISGEEEFSVKSSTLPNFTPEPLTNVIDKQLNVPGHFFIHNKKQLSKLKNYSSIDEKDPQFVLANDNIIEDQYQGWTKGDFDVLKAKLLKNDGTSYAGFTSYNYSSHKNDIGFLGSITKHLPEFIEEVTREDKLQNLDSDEQEYKQSQKQGVDKFLSGIQTLNQLKERRQKNAIVNLDKKLRDKVQQNLQKDKKRLQSRHIGKVKQLNKWVLNSGNKFLF